LGPYFDISTVEEAIKEVIITIIIIIIYLPTAIGLMPGGSVYIK
jgi:hypothetical protein